MKASAGSQEAAIIAALKRGKRITPMDALRQWGCFRLGARIYNLRMQGHAITTNMLDVGGKRVAQYQLERQA